jgi:hypothetical protein
MRRPRSVLLAALLTLGGCRSDDVLKPPPHPDDYTTPPVEDARFSQPPSYPKGTLFTDPGRKSGDVGAGGDGPAGRAGGGMGGRY